MVRQVDDLCRMRMLMAGVYVGLGISSTYGFSIFTNHLKTKYGYSQSEITTISTVGTCLNYFSFQAGMLFDFVGPVASFPIGGLLGGLGFLLFGLTFDGRIPSSVGLFALYQGITHLGLPAMDVSAVMTLMVQFPLDRGYMVMIMKVFNGLGTAVLMAYFNGWFRAADSEDPEKDNYSGYAYFVGAQILLCALVGAYFTRLPMYFPCAWRKSRLSSEEIAEREKTLDLYMAQRAPPRRLKIGFFDCHWYADLFHSPVDCDGVREDVPRGVLGDLDRGAAADGVVLHDGAAVPVSGPLHPRACNGYGLHRGGGHGADAAAAKRRRVSGA
ncbi:uncharacterized protein Tco025E_07720 [Trypanosoma conorhini]|uniref:Nodulin-like domain-containing protein n=1 Tax=Trypanosoma conorhini TaxID=83891 RepID=A0A3R7KG76_9TRYP|nr:uncharacterized protein Tco025E_07720 [Trypanosoma conorhini]RNF05864.1 hypothetical protein Tco025E_07720 [Trypanosoma conorhini]